MQALAEKVSIDDPISVLIIDDEPSILQVLKGVLNDEGYIPFTADSGELGITTFSKSTFPVVFIDMWMPGKDGIEVLREIKSLSPETQVIMISGHATITNALEAMKCGAFDFIEKPFTIDTITNALVRAVSRYKALISLGNEKSITDEEPEISKIIKSSEKNVTTEKHPGLLSKSLSGDNVEQRTIRESIVLYGQCLHTGVKSGLVLEPLPLNSGIHFSHLGSTYSVPAFISHVQSTTLATTVRSNNSGLANVSASTIEHLMAALHAYRISNLLIKCNGEVPIFDGSSKIFCDAFESVGIEEQGGYWYEIAPTETYTYSSRDSNTANSAQNEIITIEPSDILSFSYTLNYPQPVGSQFVEFVYKGPESFKNEIASARTFGFMKDVENMQRLGLAAGGRLNNFILIGQEGIVNTELRYPDELSRHKILDAIGDLFLIGRPLRAKITCKMTGHEDNISILKAIAASIKDIY
jgi:UDP-3-O-acyl N-acetylglucosamine deacetylase